MKSIILCGGYATRLYPITLDKPKALLEIRGEAVLSKIVRKINSIHDVDEILIITNGKFFNQFEQWRKSNSKQFDKKIKIINDNTFTNETRLGGLGDLQFAVSQEKIIDDLLLILGDNLFDFNLNQLVQDFKLNKNTTVAVYDVKDISEAKKMGIINLENNKITELEEKPENPKSTLSSIGIYLFTKSNIEYLNDYMETDKPKEGPAFLVQDLIKKQDVFSCELKGNWYDIGSLEIYNKLNNEWKDG